MTRRSAPGRPPFVRHLAAAIALVALGGCNTVVMNPAGDVAAQQSSLIVWSTVLMLLIIVPVMALTVLFAWRYREQNTEAAYEPDWDHSTGLELVIWAAPLLIIIALGALTWVGTHTLDPYRPLARTAPGKPVAAAVKPLEVQVVSLDWKWLFIYPEQGIATVNELVVPVDRPVKFTMTSSSVMNALWVPAMAGMIYTMPGMETVLHGVLNRTGKFEGRSGNYSGAGFSHMTFWTHSVSPARFAQWAAGVKRNRWQLDNATYLKLAAPSEKVRPIGFGTVDPGLFKRVVAMCVKPGTSCMENMSHAGPAVNDRPQRADEPEGALTRDADEKGESPHLSAPHGAAPGANDPGAGNRNMTRLDTLGLDHPALRRANASKEA
ncbi:cytochrome o ubiquinol oxidase subunit 2 [Sphingomonas sp. BE138]|uniref:ubiquinol oxidase subunit II n=1 Tax=Sphingomonas sp. BE138 TaxID=2817845 RepID=UPI002863B949|nr:ubiquinol oxidase subunit II [Sphingomonas sp. BE138]MDR6788329.1 cytochrome o ubiquinol oxidase subunit 2 [Sphingomonas sp. BE138]